MTGYPVVHDQISGNSRLNIQYFRNVVSGWISGIWYLKMTGYLVSCYLAMLGFVVYLVAGYLAKSIYGTSLHNALHFIVHGL